MKTLPSFKAGLLLLAVACLASCKESPVVDFHSYEELLEYPYYSNGWYPDIARDDLFDIRETYDTYNKHVIGRYEFKIRPRYDSMVAHFAAASKEEALKKLAEIDHPQYPAWLDDIKNLNTDKYRFFKQGDFYLLMDKKENRFIFFK